MFETYRLPSGPRVIAVGTVTPGGDFLDLAGVVNANDVARARRRITIVAGRVLQQIHPPLTVERQPKNGRKAHRYCVDLA